MRRDKGWLTALAVLTLATRTETQELTPRLDPGNYPNSYTFSKYYTVHWDCSENADMAIGQRVNGLPVVSDWHGNKKSPPTRDDSTQDLTNVEGFMNETHTFYAWTRKRLTGDDVGDELIALGPVSVLWAVGPAAPFDSPNSKFEKHLQGDTTHNVQRLELCEADPSTTTLTTTTTKTKTTTTISTTTISTTTTISSTTTTTTEEAAPDWPPLSPPNTTSSGYIDLSSKNRHGDEQGLIAMYYDYDNRPETDDLIGRYLNSDTCTTQGHYHGDMPENIVTVPQVNFPGHVRHGMGSPSNYSKNYCTSFEGWLVLPEDGVYTFEMSCSDSCRFALACSTDSKAECGNPSTKSKFSSSYNFRHDANNARERYYITAGMQVTGRNIAGEEASTYAGLRTLELDMPAGTYPIKLQHAVGPDSFEVDFEKKFGFGPQFILKWTPPNATHSQVIPAKRYLHKAPYALHFEHYPARVEKWLDGDFDTYEYIRTDGPHEGARTEGVAIIDLGYVFLVEKVEIYAVDADDVLEISVSTDLKDTKNGGRRHQICGTIQTTGTKEVVKSTGVPMVVRYNESTCGGAKGRYVILRLRGDKTAMRFREFRFKGTPLSPTQQPPLLSFTRMPKLSRNPRQHQFYKTAPEGLYRVYASISQAHYGADSGKDSQISAHRVLNENTEVCDSSSWLLSDFQTGSFILDLGFEVSVAAVRILNAHNHAYSNRGTKDLRIEAGVRGTLINAATNHSGKVLVNSSSDLALGLGDICVNALGSSWVGPFFWEGSGLTLKECQQRCIAEHNSTDPQKRCEKFSFIYYGVCRLHNADIQEEKAEGSTLTGLATCGKVPTSNPAHAIDGDINTCFRIPAGERNAYLLIDLGETVDVDDLVINTGMSNAVVKAYVGATVDEVTHEGITHNGWGDGSTSTQHCNGGKTFNIVYDSTYRHHYKAPTEVLIGCQKRGRIIVLRKMSWKDDLNLCDVKVHTRPGASWNVIDKFVLQPNMQYRFETPVPGSSSSWANEVGLGPWVQRTFHEPVKTRYLRFTAESYYKMGAGLARVEVFSDQQVPRFQIQSRTHVTDPDPLPGLRAELYDFIGGLHSRMTTPARLDELFRESLPRSATAVPVVDFLQDTSSENTEQREFGIFVKGETVVGSSSSGSKQLTVQFDVPFGRLPAVAVELHSKHYDKNAANDALTEQLKRFTLSASAVTKKGFVLYVTTKDKKKWDLISSANSMPLTVAWKASARFPTFVDDHLVEDPENTRFANTFNARFTGELVPQWTGLHKIYLAGGPLIRMVLDNKDVGLKYTYSDEREYNSTKKKWEWKGIQKTQEIVHHIELTKGKAVPIQLDFSSWGSHWASVKHSIALHWERDGVGRTIVPTLALQHGARKMCLGEALSPWGTDKLYTTECDAKQLGQAFRFDGGFIRADGALGVLNSGTAATRCLYSDNQAFDNILMRGADRPQKPLGDIRGCNNGGLSRTFAFHEKSTLEEIFRKSQLWRFESETGVIRSLSDKPVTPLGITPCADVYEKSKQTDGNKKYDERYLCDVNHTAAPSMCLASVRTSTAVAGTRKHLASLAPCIDVLHNPGLQWDLIPLLKPKQESVRGEIVFEGRYERIPNYLHHTPRSPQRLKNTAYVLRFRCNSKDGCPACPKGTEGNTCIHACNGVCDEGLVGMWMNGGDSRNGDCESGTDTYDCHYSRGGVRECEKACSKDDECTGFRTVDFEMNPEYVVCEFTGNSMENNLYWIPQYTSYSKVMLRSGGVETPAKKLASPLTPSCSTYTDAKRCPAERCKWIVEGELLNRMNSSAPIEDPECKDTNTYPDPGGAFFSCNQYVEISKQEKFYGKKDDLCSTEYVGRICSITCNATEYCKGTEYVCADASDLTAVGGTAAPDQAQMATCAGDGVVLLHGRCRCLSNDRAGRSRACSNENELHKFPCRSSSAGGGGSVAAWFPPSCTTCACTDQVNSSFAFDPHAPGEGNHRGDVGDIDLASLENQTVKVEGGPSEISGGGKAAAGVVVTLLILAVCGVLYYKKRTPGGHTHLLSFAINLFSTTNQKFDKFQSDDNLHFVDNEMYEPGVQQPSESLESAGNAAAATAQLQPARPARPARAAPKPDTLQASVSPAVKSWLEEHNLGQHISAFNAAAGTIATMEDLAAIDCQALDAMGITKKGHRKRILAAIQSKTSISLVGATTSSSTTDGDVDGSYNSNIVPALAPARRGKKRGGRQSGLGLLNADGMMEI